MSDGVSDEQKELALPIAFSECRAELLAAQEKNARLEKALEKIEVLVNTASEETVDALDLDEVLRYG